MSKGTPSYENCWGVPDPAPSVDMTQYSTDTQLAQEFNTDVPHIYAYAEHWGYSFETVCNPDFDGVGVTNPSIGALPSGQVEEFVAKLKAASDDELLAIWKPWCEAGIHLEGQCETLAAETRTVGIQAMSHRVGLVRLQKRMETGNSGS